VHHDKQQKGKGSGSTEKHLVGHRVEFCVSGHRIFLHGAQGAGCIVLILIATTFAAAMLSNPLLFGAISSAWFGVFIITCIDMLILHSKNRKETTKACPYCAEPIKKEAVFCLHCKKDIVVA
jgi:hypothetical protein